MRLSSLYSLLLWSRLLRELTFTFTQAVSCTVNAWKCDVDCMTFEFKLTGFNVGTLSFLNWNGLWMIMQIKCAFVEIYNEEIKDLLHPDTPSKAISIREDANGDIILAGVREEEVSNFKSMIRYPYLFWW